jgi:tRNA U34 5-methylaminomethyl-2-thiouridine-forming methyltransferase MnmC
MYTTNNTCSDPFLTHVIPIQTNDGSLTLFDGSLQATYRSRFGAQTESEYVFIQGTRLESCLLEAQLLKKESVTILELGFGAGINFSLSALLCHKYGIALNYIAIEYQPVAPYLLPSNGWPTVIAKNALNNLATKEVSIGTSSGSPTEDGRDLDFEGAPSTSLKVYRSKWQDLPSLNLEADCYYHDPFGPAVNPSCWEKQAFQWAYGNIRSGGYLATYGAASRVKKALKEVNFNLQVRAGLPPKREVIAALKS